MRKVSSEEVAMKFVIHSHLGSTDCAGCEIYRHGRILFAKPLGSIYDRHHKKFVSLPLKVAEFPDVQTAAVAYKKIQMAIKKGKEFIDLRD